MLLIHLHRPQPLEFFTHSAHIHGDEADPVSPAIYALVLVLACCGGVGHGVAMAIKKKYGEGIEKYWLEWRWWVGNILDACSGIMIWPAMPYVSVQIFAPLIIVVQLGSSYILGLLMFNEKSVLLHNVGLACAIIGVIGVSFSTSHGAANFTIDQFWAGWLHPRFLVVMCVIIASLVGSFFVVHRVTFWALLAAAFEGIQYICSRAIVDSLFQLELGFITQPAVGAAFAIKGCCILGIIHSQQLGLESDLSRFAGIYLVSCVMFMCICGAAFFGDEMPFNFLFCASALFTLAGIWLLNQKEEDPENNDIAKAIAVVGEPGDPPAKPVTA